MLKTGEPMEGQQAASYREIRIFVGGRPLPIFFNGKNLHAMIRLFLERLCEFCHAFPFEFTLRGKKADIRICVLSGSRLHPEIPEALQ